MLKRSASSLSSAARLSAAMLAMLFAASCAFALEPLADEEMSEQTGEGMALGFTDIRLLAGPTSYFEALGQAPTVPVGQLKRGDGRYYGISISGTTPVSSWVGPCGAGIANMGCPIGDTIPYFAPFDNPFLLRVFDYSNYPTIANGGSNAATLAYSGLAQSQPVFELLAPTNQDGWRMSMWTEVRINATNTNLLQGQLIMNNSKLFTQDNPAAPGARMNNKIRIVKHTDAGDPTIGIIWENHWQGDFRYSVNQLFSSPNTYGVVPFFSDSEGFYARNIKSFVPMGQMFYQDIILDDTAANDGNFILELTRPNPSSAAVYGDFYSLSAGDTTGYKRCDVQPCTTATNYRPARWYETHGYFQIGDWFPTCAGANCLPASGGAINAVSSTADGMFFVAYDPVAVGARFNAFSNRQDTSNMDANPVPMLNNANNGNYNIINLGDTRIYGMTIQHLSIVTRGI